MSEKVKVIYDNCARLKSKVTKAERVKHEYLKRNDGLIDLNDPEYQALVKTHEDAKRVLEPWQKMKDELPRSSYGWAISSSPTDSVSLMSLNKNR